MENTNYQQNPQGPQGGQEEQTTEISLRSIWSFFINNWLWFGLSVFGCLCLGFLYCKVSPKIYSSSAVIYIDENASRSVKSDVTSMTNLRMMRQTSVVDNESAILRSYTLMNKVVENLNANICYSVQAKLRKVEIYGPSAPVEVVVDSLKYPFSLELQLNSNDLTGKIKWRFPGSRKDSEQKFAVAYGSPVVSEVGIFRVVANDNLAEATKKDNRLYVSVANPSRYTRAMLTNLSVAPTSKTTSLINVSMKSPVAQKAADLVNELIYVYNEDAKEGERAVARATMEFVDERLGVVGADLESVDSEVESYRKKSRSVNSMAEGNIYLQTANKLEEEAVKIETQRVLLNDILTSVNKTMGKVELVANLGLEDQSLNGIITDYNNAVLEYKMMGGDEKLSNPSVANIREKVLALQALLPQSIANLRTSLDLQLRSVEKQIAENRAKVNDLPTIEKEAQSIMRDQEIKVEIYSFLLNKREETSLKLATTASISRVIDPAMPAQFPISPRTMMIMLLALIVGFVIPVVVILVAEALRNKIYSVEEVESEIGSAVSIVGAIPSKEDKKSNDILVTPNSRDAIAEAFRMVRTNIDFMMPEGGKVLMVTSTIPHEGKTTVALNVALSFAITGKKVIVVDMDLRKGSMEQRIGDEHHTFGVVNYLVGKESNIDNLIVRDCLHDVDALFVGTIPPNPAELIMRKQLDDLFVELRKRYDYVIVDTAPIALVTDTMVANRVADMTLYCMRMGHTEKMAFETIKAVAGRKSLKNMGVVMSDVGVETIYYGGEKRKQTYGYGYGYGYGYVYGYGYGYGHGKDGKKNRYKGLFGKLFKKKK